MLIFSVKYISIYTSFLCTFFPKKKLSDNHLQTLPTWQLLCLSSNNNISMLVRNLWKVNITNGDTAVEIWHTIISQVRLVHVLTTAMKFSGKQHEVVTDTNIEGDDYSRDDTLAADCVPPSGTSSCSCSSRCLSMINIAGLEGDMLLTGYFALLSLLLLLYLDSSFLHHYLPAYIFKFMLSSNFVSYISLC